jgi:hypothetical protein
MATPIERIEKNFLLKVLYDEQIPITYVNNRTEYTLRLEKPAVTEMMYFKSDRIIPGLRIKQKMNAMFTMWWRVVSFSTEIISFQDEHIVAAAPVILYKDLDRSYLRIPAPPDIKIQFLFSGERYSLAYPKVQEFERELCFGAVVKNIEPKDLTGLISQFDEWVKDYANEYQIIIFKEDVKPASIEERLIAETGKTLYLASTKEGSLPQTDPFPKKRLVTEDIFRRFMESSGTEPQHLDSAVSRFIQAKSEAGFLADVWVPIQFHQYVTGYFHFWSTDGTKRHIGYDVLDTVFQFASIAAFSLKENGYFDAGRMKNAPFSGKIIDISASGILFAYPNSEISSFLLPDSDLVITIITPTRSITANARIVRRFRDSNQEYFGCRFQDMTQEDTRFLFEFIYGRPFTGSKAGFLSGQV